MKIKTLLLIGTLLCSASAFGIHQHKTINSEIQVLSFGPKIEISGLFEIKSKKKITLTLDDGTLYVFRRDAAAKVDPYKELSGKRVHFKGNGKKAKGKATHMLICKI